MNSRSLLIDRITRIFWRSSQRSNKLAITHAINNRVHSPADALPLHVLQLSAPSASPFRSFPLLSAPSCRFLISDDRAALHNVTSLTHSSPAKRKLSESAAIERTDKSTITRSALMASIYTRNLAPRRAGAIRLWRGRLERKNWKGRGEGAPNVPAAGAFRKFPRDSSRRGNLRDGNSLIRPRASKLRRSTVRDDSKFTFHGQRDPPTRLPRETTIFFFLSQIRHMQLLDARSRRRCIESRSNRDRADPSDALETIADDQPPRHTPVINSPAKLPFERLKARETRSGRDTTSNQR